MKQDYYNKDTVDARLDSIHDTLKNVEGKVDVLNKKVEYTNGKVKKHQQLLLVAGTAILVILFMSGSKFFDLIKSLFL